MYFLIPCNLSEEQTICPTSRYLKAKSRIGPFFLWCKLNQKKAAHEFSILESALFSWNLFYTKFLAGVLQKKLAGTMPEQPKYNRVTLLGRFTDLQLAKEIFWGHRHTFWDAHQRVVTQSQASVHTCVVLVWFDVRQRHQRVKKTFCVPYFLMILIVLWLLKTAQIWRLLYFSGAVGTIKGLWQCNEGYQHVVCGSGPGGSRAHNRRRVRHRGTKQPRLGRTAAVESNSSVCFKRLLTHSCLKLLLSTDAGCPGRGFK